VVQGLDKESDHVCLVCTAAQAVIVLFFLFLGEVVRFRGEEAGRSRNLRVKVSVQDTQNEQFKVVGVVEVVPD
jgi:hypothetical protein